MLLAATAVGFAACVTTYEDAPVVVAERTRPKLVPLAIPFPTRSASDEDRVAMELYGGVIERLQAAAKDRDAPQIEALLAAYERPGLPTWLRSVLDGYRALAVGIRFQQHVVGHATLAPEPAVAGAAAEPPIGAPVRFLLSLPAQSSPVVLGGRDDEDPIGFAVAVTIEDTFVDGSTRTSKTQDTVWLPARLDLAGDRTLRLPIGLEIPGADAVQRVVHVRLDMLPGYVRVDGTRAPVHRKTIGAVVMTQWPAGHEAIAKAPLPALRTALQIGDAAHFRHVYLAAHFANAVEREEMLPLLIDQVRCGRPEMAQVATAALREATGERLPLGDRQAWLAWWQARR